MKEKPVPRLFLDISSQTLDGYHTAQLQLGCSQPTIMVLQVKRLDAISWVDQVRAKSKPHLALLLPLELYPCRICHVDLWPIDISVNLSF